MLLMMLFVLLLSSIANADGGEDASLLPNDILQILSGTEWSSYKVGRVNCGSSLADYYSDACCWYDQYGHAAAFVLMHSENKNVLCLFEKNSAGKWVLKAKSSEIVKQGERIPLITSEEYGIYYVSYIDDDRKSELSLEIEKKKDGWYVTRINWDKDNVFMELSLYENKIEYLKIVYANGGSKSTRTTVEGVTPPTSFAEFSLDNIPMTPEKARAQLARVEGAQVGGINRQALGRGIGLTVDVDVTGERTAINAILFRQIGTLVEMENHVDLA